MIGYAILGFVYSIVALCTCKYQGAKKPKMNEEKKISKKMKTVKIMSIIGLVVFFGLFLFFFYEFYYEYKWFKYFQAHYDERGLELFEVFARTALSCILLIFAIPYTILYSIVGLSLFKKKTVFLTGLILGVFQLGCALWYIASDEHPYAYYVYIADIFVFAVYIVGLVQSLKQEGKKNSRKYLWFILGGFIVTVTIIVSLLFFQWKSEQSTENKEYYGETETTEQVLSEEISNSKDYDYGLSKSELPADFLSFLNGFTSSREAQISLIHIPLIHNFMANVEHEESTDYEEKTEYWDAEKIITNWNWWKSNEFIWGLKKNKNKELFGSWKLKNDEIYYNYGVPETDNVWSLTFKKIDGNWCLISFWTNESGL